MRLVLVAAARPNFMKVAPVLTALDARGAEVLFVHTGQHYDDDMSEAFFRDLDIRAPDRHLAVGSGSHAVQTGAVMVAFEQTLASVQADAVVVAGDVNSTLACALVASKAAVPVAHIEAGLRSADRRMPEEINRLCTDTLSDWLFTPSRDADANLRSEGIDDSRIFFVGNVMVDSLLLSRRAAKGTEMPRRLGVAARRYTLVTLHRPSSVDDPSTLERLVTAVLRVSDREPVVFPVHPRTRSRLETSGLMERLESASGVKVTEPLGHRDFVALLDEAHVVITDSGGVQEEATVLGVPCLTVRENTERPTTVLEGTNAIVGSDPATIVSAHATAPFEHVERRPELWDGRAGERIAEVLLTVEPPLSWVRQPK